MRSGSMDAIACCASGGREAIFGAVVGVLTGGLELFWAKTKMLMRKSANVITTSLRIGRSPMESA